MAYGKSCLASIKLIASSIDRLQYAIGLAMSDYRLHSIRYSGLTNTLYLTRTLNNNLFHSISDGICQDILHDF